MGSALHSFFAWPDGGVWSNLLASALWAIPAFTWHHKTVMARLDRNHKASMARAKAHHEELLQEVRSK